MKRHAAKTAAGAAVLIIVLLSLIAIAAEYAAPAAPFRATEYFFPRKEAISSAAKVKTGSAVSDSEFKNEAMFQEGPGIKIHPPPSFLKDGDLGQTRVPRFLGHRVHCERDPGDLFRRKCDLPCRFGVVRELAHLDGAPIAE